MKLIQLLMVVVLLTFITAPAYSQKSVENHQSKTRASQKSTIVEGEVWSMTDTFPIRPLMHVIGIKTPQGVEYKGLFKLSRLASISSGKVSDDAYPYLMGRRVRLVIIDLKPDPD